MDGLFPGGKSMTAKRVPLGGGGVPSFLWPASSTVSPAAMSAGVSSVHQMSVETAPDGGYRELVAAPSRITFATRFASWPVTTRRIGGTSPASRRWSGSLRFSTRAMTLPLIGGRGSMPSAPIPEECPTADGRRRDDQAMNEVPFRAVGKPLPRKEDERLITGQGRFSDDFHLDGQAHAVMVRSPHPHARIAGVNAARARPLPGVLGVFTGADCLADGLAPIPHDPLPKTKYDMKLAGPGGAEVFIGPHLLLPADKVRHVGEAVAMVVAETTAQALDAAEAVETTYEEMPFVIHSEDAMRAGAPAVWDEVANNVIVDTFFGDPDATDRAFAGADHVLAMDFHIGRVTGVPLEPRAALGAYDAHTGRYTLYAGSGGAVRQKREIAAILGIAPDAVRVLSFDVGGNFGTRNRVFVEFGLVLWAARKIGRPVKYNATRSEAFLSDYQGRDLVTKVELALRADGRFLAMRATNISNVGARCVSLSPLGKGAGLIPGSYDIPAAALRAMAVFTNTMPTNAYRSSGRQEMTFAIERLI